jgi:Flp pilus assembly protein TadB
MDAYGSEHLYINTQADNKSHQHPLRHSSVHTSAQTTVAPNHSKLCKGMHQQPPDMVALLAGCPCCCVVALVLLLLLETQLAPVLLLLPPTLLPLLLLVTQTAPAAACFNTAVTPRRVATVAAAA